MDTALPYTAAPPDQGFVRSLGAFLAGLTLLGACLGIGQGAEAMLDLALRLPSMYLAVGLLTAPALYIGSGLLGLAPPGSLALRAVERALLRAGRLVFGVAPAAAFLVATSTSAASRVGIGFLLMALTALVALRALHSGFTEARGTAPATLFNWLYAGWSFLTLGIGFFWLLSPLDA